MNFFEMSMLLAATLGVDTGCYIMFSIRLRIYLCDSSLDALYHGVRSYRLRSTVVIFGIAFLKRSLSSSVGTMPKCLSAPFDSKMPTPE